MKILIIEPDKSLASNYQKYLQHEGHDVNVCLAAQQAITAIDADKPDVIICELLLAQHNGIEFLYEFRSYPEWQNIPVVILSMVPISELKDYRHSFKQLGVKRCLYKPQASLSELGYAISSLESVYY